MSTCEDEDEIGSSIVFPREAQFDDRPEVKHFGVFGVPCSRFIQVVQSA